MQQECSRVSQVSNFDYKVLVDGKFSKLGCLPFQLDPHGTLKSIPWRQKKSWETLVICVHWPSSWVMTDEFNIFSSLVCIFFYLKEKLWNTLTLLLCKHDEDCSVQQRFVLSFHSVNRAMMTRRMSVVRIHLTIWQNYHSTNDRKVASNEVKKMLSKLSREKVKLIPSVLKVERRFAACVECAVIGAGEN